MDRTIATLSGNEFIQRVPSNALNIVTVFCDLPNALPYSYRSVLASITRNNSTYTHTVVCREYSRSIIRTSRNDVFPSGTPCQVIHLHCRTPKHRLNKNCEGNIHNKKTNLNGVLAFQYSFSYCNSSGARSEPNAAVGAELDGAQTMIIPSTSRLRDQKHENRRSYEHQILLWETHHHRLKRSHRLYTKYQDMNIIKHQHPHLTGERTRHDIPLGLNLTTFTGAECRLSVDRYSIRGG